MRAMQTHFLLLLRSGIIKLLFIHSSVRYLGGITIMPSISINFTLHYLLKS